MYLTGLVHRDRLFTIAMRWFGDSPVEDDGKVVTEVFLFEPLISGPATRSFAVEVLHEAFGETLTYEPVRLKDQVRERVVEGIPGMTPRLEYLVHQYRAYPEEFFPRTPIDGVIFRTESGRLVGISRIKRPRRIAEKAARRMADRLIHLIRNEADLLAYERAERVGLPAERLLTSPEEMAAEFVAAERSVARQFRTRTLTLSPDDLRIDDVLGLKFIGTEDELARIESVILRHPRARLVEREEHRGNYNAVNLQVDLILPSATECIETLGGIDWSFGALRGLPARKLERDFLPYVTSGSRSIRVEVILTTYPELVESEFGRSLHEGRIGRVRDAAEYKGRIARNAAYIIEYLLALAFSPSLDIDQIPVKLWGHYLPETVQTAINRLYGVAEAGLMFHHYLPHWTHALCVPYNAGAELDFTPSPAADEPGAVDDRGTGFGPGTGGEAATPRNGNGGR
jgi:hypothetical protein